MSEFVFYSRGESGHRPEYIDFCEEVLPGRRKRLVVAFFSKKPLLFLMVEEGVFQFFFVSMMRSLVGLKTSGLVFRAGEAIRSNTLRHRIKCGLFRALKKKSKVRLLSIVPFFVDSKIEAICDDWVYDFQFLDKDFLMRRGERKDIDRFVAEIRKQAQGRKVVCAIGKQDKGKGFEKFCELYATSQSVRDRYLFVSGGRVSNNCLSFSINFEDSGGRLYNRFINDSELIALYEVSDVIWACYSPEYDQSSGVLGRAYQFGKAVLVREGAVSDRVATRLRMNVRRAEWHEVSSFEESLASLDVKASLSERKKLKLEDFVQKIT